VSCGVNAPSVWDAITRLPLANFAAQFWLVDLRGTPGAEAVAWLSADEQARAARFIFDEHRHRFRIAHAALRALLAREIGRQPADLEFVHNAHNKPSLSDEQDCAFNMSHSDSVALIAIARGLPAGCELGVDIEELRDMRDVAGLATMNFTTMEQAELSAAAPESRYALFLNGWTRKEACLKALGSGLSVAPATFECGLAPRPARVQIVSGGAHSDIEVESIAVDPRHVAAVALLRAPRDGYHPGPR